MSCSSKNSSCCPASDGVNGKGAPGAWQATHATAFAWPRAGSPLASAVCADAKGRPASAIHPLAMPAIICHLNRVRLAPVTDTVNRAGLFIRYQHRTVGHQHHIGRAAPETVIGLVEKAGHERRSLGVFAVGGGLDQHHVVADALGLVP